MSSIEFPQLLEFLRAREVPLTTSTPWALQRTHRHYRGVCPGCGAPMSLYSDRVHSITDITCEAPVPCSASRLMDALGRFSEDASPLVDPISNLFSDTDQQAALTDVGITLPYAFPPPAHKWTCLLADAIPASQLSSTLPPSLVNGLIFHGMNMAIIGRRGVGKTFFALDLALSIASGTQFLGIDTVKSPVLYVAAEGTPTLGPRINAWCTSHDVDISTLDDTFLLITEPVNIADPEVGDQFAAEMARQPVGLVILDTLARNTLGIDENARHDMDRVIGFADTVRRVLPDIVVCFIHHPNASGASRGSSSFEAALDLVLSLSGTMADLDVSRSKAKYTEDGPLLRLTTADDQTTAPVLTHFVESTSPAAFSVWDLSLVALYDQLGFYQERLASGFTRTDAIAVLRDIPTYEGELPTPRAALKRWHTLLDDGHIVPLDPEKPNRSPFRLSDRALHLIHEIGGVTRPVLAQFRAEFFPPVDNDEPSIF